MKRALVVVLSLLVVAGSVPAAAAFVGGGSGLDAASQATAENRTATAPGATFAGVVNVQGAEVDNEVQQRALDQRLAAADSNASKAAVVAAVTARLQERVEVLETRRAQLEAAYENGSISQAAYQARLAALAAQLRGLENRANRTAEAAAALPEAALRRHGVTVSEVRSLAQRADEIGGQAVAEAARRIAGEDVGDGLGGPPEDRGRPGAGNESDDRPGQGDDRGNGQAGNETGSNGAPGRDDGQGADAETETGP